MAHDLVLTIDAGTGSSRACVYDVAQNRPLSVAARDCPIEHPAPGLAEWQPTAWWQAIVEAISQAVAGARRPGSDRLHLPALHAKM